MRTLREGLTKRLGEGGYDTVRFDGAQGARILADVMDECRSFGLMQQHKIVLVDNAEILVKADEDEAPAAPKGKRGGPRAPTPLSPREVLENYAEEPSGSATLILRAGTWRPGNLDKKVLALPDGQGVIVKCEQPTAADAARWAIGRAQRRHGTSIDVESAAALVDTTGPDLGRIDSELEKLALAAGGDGSPITVDLVENMVGKTRQDEFFSIQKVLLTGSSADALAHLRDLIEVSRHDPVPITFAYVETARKIHLACRGVKEGRNVFSMQSALKAWGPGSEEMLAALARIAKQTTPRQAAGLLKAAVSVDAGNKSGLGDPVRNLEVLTVKFAELAHSGSGGGVRR